MSRLFFLIKLIIRPRSTICNIPGRLMRDR